MQLYHVSKDTSVNAVIINGNDIVTDTDILSKTSHTFFEYEILADRNGFQDGRVPNFPSKVLVKIARMAKQGCTAFLLSPHNSSAFLGYDIGKRGEAALIIVPDHSLQETNES